MPPKQDPIFDHYKLGALSAPNFEVDFMGARVAHDVEPKGFSPDLSVPAPSEAYFEYIDILESVASAGDSFSMLEIGGGFGRWSVVAACAARQKQKRAWFGLVEADPRLIGKLHKHLADNGVTNYRVWPFALTKTAGAAPFLVRQPEGQRVDGWLGQSITRNDTSNARAAGEYYGHPLWELANGAAFIHVEQCALSQVLAECEGVIDLADFDIQGDEADVVDEAVDALSARVRRLHIGTHGKDIEERLRKTLSDAGWTMAADYTCHAINETPFGPVSFGDGVQSWRNPRQL